MLDAIVGFVVVLLVGAGILVIIGPGAWAPRRSSFPRLSGLAALFEPRRRPREVIPPALNPKTQRVLVAAARLANWMRAHGHEDVARDIRNAAARISGNEPAGRYALQTSPPRIRVVNINYTASQGRLQALPTQLRTPVQARVEQLELLPVRRPL